MLHAFEWRQRHVEVTVGAGPKGAQTLAVEVLGILHVKENQQMIHPSVPLITF